MAISIFEAPRWVGLMGKKIRDAGERGLLSAAIRTVAHIQTEVIPREPRIPVDRGIYRAGWRAVKIPKGAMVINTVPHAVLIEYGVRASNVKAGRKMIEALTAWVKRKGFGGKKGADAASIAWAIAMSMKKKGIFDGGKGLHILGKASKKIPQFIDEEIGREIGRI